LLALFQTLFEDLVIDERVVVLRLLLWFGEYRARMIVVEHICFCVCVCELKRRRRKSDEKKEKERDGMIWIDHFLFLFFCYA